ncbi:MAG: MoxR family ATPase [Rhodothermaceae bacterium]|nr:MoxR family ATPase [Rhodothermaceae bacterium]MXX58116.1 MoxR family ATPase [Rhodothermaceae bacterium]MYD19005.1 MoxR family ATPase [Rhodothermaceae bacterium]MYD55399.1 MoxR family ATPase [Rhodothermaceae bacterium]MYI43407.1 MoxR family ATPase [Rhodothermaceae bacterium]
MARAVSIGDPQPEEAYPALAEALPTACKRLEREISKVIVGQKEIIRDVLVCLLARGHVLLIGVPGLAKTLLIRTLAKALKLDFTRIQFTPDLMPGDITGTEIIEEDRRTGKRVFRFVKGPIFANVVLADEVNRTPPKTQAALLEAMQEHRVTAGGTTFSLDEPFFVLATQNPIEQEGTYPLPEAQLDRFMLNLWLDYPSFDQEVEVVRSTTAAQATIVQPAMSQSELLNYQDLVRQLPVANNVIEYAVRLVTNTRPNREDAPDFVNNYIAYGAGPRASQYLILGAKALAAMDGRLTPLISDVQALAIAVLRHRVIANFNAEADGITVTDLVDRLLATITV